jgi:acrylyl-CoA reductase (NADPH)
MGSFKALLLEEADGKVTSRLTELDEAQLPAGEVTVAVRYSTLNYKDGLVLNGLGRLVRKYPHVPGIDFAGVVTDSASPDYEPGDEVILTGWGVGESHWGGYASRARVQASQLVTCPKGLSLQHAMAIGTAGFTAMLAIMALEDHGLTPNAGEVLVTGGAGGVGSIAIALLAALGYDIAASSGRPALRDYLKDLGAKVIIERQELAQLPTRPLATERWAGAIDAVGGTTLANLLTQLRYRGSVASCGLAGGTDLRTTVIPFLLRGVNLLGIDSVKCPIDRRRAAWDRLARDLPLKKLDAMTETIGLAAVPERGKQILKGEIHGRVVVNLTES